MKYIDDFKGPIKKGIEAALGTVARFHTASLEVLMLDVENIGLLALTGFKIFARASHSAPFRDITPVSWTAESALLWRPAGVSLATLAAGASTQFGLNVTAYESIELQASGAGTVLLVAAGGYEVRS